MKKRDLLKNYIFYGLLSIFVFFNIDLSTMLLIRISGMNIYYGDIFFFLVLATIVWVFVKNGNVWHWTQPVTAWYLLFLVWLALGRKIREIWFVCASVAIIFALMHIFPDIERFYYPVQSRRQVPDLSRQQVPDLNFEQVKGMQTGYWRLYQSTAALRLALKKPFFGHHLGGYFNFFIPETKEKNFYPPHNQYIYIFLKTGIVGLALLLVPLLLLLRRLFKFLADERLEKSEISSVWLLLLVLLSQFPYGMGFGFIPLYAVYFGFGAIFLDSLAKKYLPQLRIKKD